MQKIRNRSSQRALLIRELRTFLTMLLAGPCANLPVWLPCPALILLHSELHCHRKKWSVDLSGFPKLSGVAGCWSWGPLQWDSIEAPKAHRQLYPLHYLFITYTSMLVSVYEFKPSVKTLALTFSKRNCLNYFFHSHLEWSVAEIISSHVTKNSRPLRENEKTYWLYPNS